MIRNLLCRSWPTVQRTFMQYVNAPQFVAMATRNSVTSELSHDLVITSVTYGRMILFIYLSICDSSYDVSNADYTASKDEINIFT
jgi:hypothetical protein